MDLVVLVAFCSLTAQSCGLGILRPAGPESVYDDRAACRARATVLDDHRAEQEKALQSITKLPPPWTAHAVCGTLEQAAEVTMTLKQWEVLQSLDEEKQSEEERQHFNQPDGG